jgi:ribonuclease Z
MAFSVTILGNSSAKRTHQAHPSAQVVNINEQYSLVDAGEGVQQQLIRRGISPLRLRAVFISHLHGDHCFGLIGLISTFGLLGRTAPLHIYADPMLEELMKPQIEFFCKGMHYPLFFHGIDTTMHQTIYEDNTITVETLPLRHRIPCCGFLFREKPKRRHLLGDVANFYNIPAYMRQSIKDGADYTTPEGEIIKNFRLTKDADPSRSYAYCSDTAPCNNSEFLRGVDLLYHEATFADSEKERAAQTFHSTAKQAAQTASDAGVKKLVIGHYSSRYETPSTLLAEARELFSNTIAAKEGDIIRI